MANEYYDHGSYPATGASGSSAALRAELDSIEAGFNKLPVLSGNGGKKVRVKADASGLEAVADTTSAAYVYNTPAGNITATTVQAAINELDSEKAAATHSHTTSDVTGLDAALAGKAATSHNHTGVYEPADATILKEADIGAVGGVQAYDADTAKTDVAQTWTASQKSGGITDDDGSFDLSGAGNNYASTPTSAVAITFTNIAANANKSGYITLINGSNYAYTAHTNTKISTTDLAKIGATGTYVMPYLCDGTDVLILGAWKKP